DETGVSIDQAGMSAGSAYGEGTRLSPLTANTNQSYERLSGGASGSCVDTQNNDADFQVISPSDPQDLASTITPCGAPPTPTPLPGILTGVVRDATSLLPLKASVEVSPTNAFDNSTVSDPL